MRHVDFYGLATFVVALGIGARLVVLTAPLRGGLVALDSGLLTQILVLVVLVLGFVFQQIGRSQQIRADAERQEANRKTAIETSRLLAENQRLAAAVLAQATTEQTALLTARNAVAHAETLAAVEAVHVTAANALDQANHTNAKIASAVEAMRGAGTPPDVGSP